MKIKATDSQAVVAGHICLDIIPTFADGAALPVPGQLMQIGAALLSTGGPVSNTGLALRHLGVETRLMGKVGEDAFGRVVLNLIRARDPRLADGIIVAPRETTSYSIVLNLPGRDRAFLHCPGANDTFRSSDSKLDTIAATRLFHFGYPPLMAQMYADNGMELVELFRTVKNLGVTTSLDMVMVDRNSRAGRADWKAILKALLPKVDIFLPSLEEMLLLLRPSEYERLNAGGALLEQITPGLLSELASMLLDWGARIAGLKLGHRGLYLRTGALAELSQLGRAAPPKLERWANRELWSPIFQAERFVGATGSGDATIAGFLAAWLAGCSPEETVTFACAVGACNVEAADALSGLQDWEATWARIRAGWERAPLHIVAPGWHYDAAQHLWLGPADRSRQ